MNQIMTSFNAFQKRFPKMEILEHIKDDVGMYALLVFNKETGRRSFFSAKNSMDGDMVSIHLRLFQKMHEKGFPMTLAIGDDKIYIFTRDDILKFALVNDRKGILMLNFRLKQGISWQPAAVQERVAEKQTPTLFEPDAPHPVIQAMTDRLGAVAVRSAP